MWLFVLAASADPQVSTRRLCFCSLEPACGPDHRPNPCPPPRQKPDPTWAVVLSPGDHELLPRERDLDAVIAWFGRGQRGPDGAWWLGGAPAVVQLDGVRMDDRGGRMGSGTAARGRPEAMGPLAARLRVDPR